MEASCLLSVVMSKLPQDLRLIITREVRDEWDLDHIVDVFKSELEAKERVNGNNINPTDQSSTKPPYNRGREELPLSTEAALFATGSKPTCTYCRENHASNACQNVTSIAARKEILKRAAGRCFVSLKGNHMSIRKDSSSRVKCLKCRRVSTTIVFVLAILKMKSSLYTFRMLRDQLPYLKAEHHTTPGENLVGGPQFCMSMHQRPSFFRLPRQQFTDLAPVVQTMESAVHRINHYPADKH